MEKISLSQESIVLSKCDAIVNAANSSLLGGGGVDGAIHEAAGPDLVKECAGLGGCKTGEAKITAGYKLNAKYVFHTVGPIYGGKNEDAALLAACYRNSLDLARDNDLHSIAFPAISTGVYGYPLGEATEIAVKTVATWLRANPDYDLAVVFHCFREREFIVYNDVLKRFS